MEDPVERDDERELFKQPGREQRLGPAFGGEPLIKSDGAIGSVQSLSQSLGITKGEGAIGSEYQPMPVRGYKPQSSDNLNLVNAGKELEAALIAYLAKLAALDGTDKRMLALAKSNVQCDCM